MGDHRKANSPGRPRTPGMDELVLATTRRLVADRGYPAVTMNDIARDAGIAKQTLYRRWPGKAELVLDAFLQSAAEASAAPYTTLFEAVHLYLSGVFTHLAQDGAAIRSLIASAQTEADFLQHFRDRFVRPRAKVFEAILAIGRERGDITDDVDFALISGVVHGGFWYRLLLGEPLDERFASQLAGVVERLATAQSVRGAATNAPG